MPTLDNQKTIKKYNKSKVLDSISLLPEQIAQSWQEAGKIKLPVGYSRFDNIIFCGMGGSNLASETIRRVYIDQIDRPFILVRGYHLPKFASSKSLVIVSSYSGNTEETNSCLHEALAKKAKIICLSSGGRIKQSAKKFKLPYYQMSQKYNPSRQPRYGIGLQLGTVLAIFSKLKIIKITSKEMKELVDYLDKLNTIFESHVLQKENLAKNLAVQFNGFMPIMVAGEFLSANVHILANQINESAKNLANYYLLPELNHHLLEGLALPKAVAVKIKFLFFNSSLYSKNIKQRVLATQKVLSRRKIKSVEYFVDGDNKLLTALEILLFGNWFSFYLAVLNKQDPAKIPWVDFFKKEMKK